MGRGFGGVWGDCRGISALEYALLGGVLAAVIAYGMSLEAEGIAQAWRVIMAAFPSG